MEHRLVFPKIPTNKRPGAWSRGYPIPSFFLVGIMEVFTLKNRSVFQEIGYKSGYLEVTG